MICNPDWKLNILGSSRSSACYYVNCGEHYSKIKPPFFFRKMDVMLNRVSSWSLLINAKIVVKNYPTNLSSRLIRHLYPTDQELKNLAGIPREKGKKGKNSDHEKTNETFHVPRNLDVTLETAKVSPLDVVHLKFYSDFQWLFDFSVYAIIVYLSTEVSRRKNKSKKKNTLKSVLWIFNFLWFVLDLQPLVSD